MISIFELLLKVLSFAIPVPLRKSNSNSRSNLAISNYDDRLALLERAMQELPSDMSDKEIELSFVLTVLNEYRLSVRKCRNIDDHLQMTERELNAKKDELANEREIFKAALDTKEIEKIEELKVLQARLDAEARSSADLRHQMKAMKPKKGMERKSLNEDLEHNVQWHNISEIALIFEQTPNLDEQLNALSHGFGLSAATLTEMKRHKDVIMFERWIKFLEAWLQQSKGPTTYEALIRGLKSRQFNKCADDVKKLMESKFD